MLLRTVLFYFLFFGCGLAAAQPCPSRLFVSGWHSTVHVFDACTGAYLRDLDSRTRLVGAMAVRLGPDGFLYAVAEGTGTIHKYRNDTLEHAGVFANVGAAVGATGLAFGPDGTAYVAGYNSDDVKRFDRAGVALGPAFPARSAGLNGPDSGMTFGPDGNLYVPGYDSHSVVRWDPRTGAATVAVASRAGGLFNSRGLLPARDGRTMFLTGEGSGQLLRFELESGAVAEVARGFSGPTGVAYAPDGKLLVAHGDGVERVDPDTGARLGTFVAPAAGGIASQVFLAVIDKPAAASVDLAQVGTQYWVVGDARFDGRTLVMPQVYSASGTAFGPHLARGEIAIKRWGTVSVELLSCTRARFRWDASGADSAGFGSGSYDVERFFENGATARCREQGLDHADRSWVNGQWWGGAARSGEGLFLDRNADGTTFFAWFTHRPAAGATGVDASQVGSQYWIVGDARFEGRALDIGGAYSATGTGFGPALSRAQIAIKRWGRVRLELVSCTEARFTWDSTGADSAGFGAGGYTVTRFFENEDTARCRAQGIDHADRSWASGQWWGGAARSGEGLFLDVRTDGTAFFAWFTHRPR